jgi:hypothetical protein
MLCPSNDDGMDIAKKTFIRFGFCNELSIQESDTIHNIPDKVMNRFFYS